MENVEHCEDKQKEVRSGYSLDGLLEMDWGNGLSPLVDFMNLGSGSAELQQAVREYNIHKEKRAPVEDFMNLRKDMASVLESFYSMRTWADAQFLEGFLNERLESATNRVKVIDLGSKRIRVDLEAGNIIQDLWADFICIFLYRSNWIDLLGKCPTVWKMV